MPSPDAYTVLARPAQHEIEIRRSRFIACLRRVESEDEARAFFAEIAAAYPDARHRCTAFALGPERRVQRSNDDGEPSGTAGRPMLEALTLASPLGEPDLSDVAAVVVRYFGGVLLGAGGLTRAYSSAVSEALETATFATRARRELFAVSVPHANAGHVEAEIRRAGFAVAGTDYEAQAVIHVAAAAGAGEDLARLLASVTRGEAEPTPEGEAWIDV
ncbi:YigZ family protein [Falsarthrobacter nasiphocae]|uniref:YigZ family protein n=1 Tax=Falsarthrobacter nasiphocae TaxID=189863 RepID=A0AAE3YFW2_9MICC|nr:YigZ family protein [Falsarthrobacter nasiphocae]MDR6891178.1 putative YigZ family protein [Falsarthrobacter nasiphocae]